MEIPGIYSRANQDSRGGVRAPAQEMLMLIQLGTHRITGSPEISSGLIPCPMFVCYAPSMLVCLHRACFYAEPGLSPSRTQNRGQIPSQEKKVVSDSVRDLRKRSVLVPSRCCLPSCRSHSPRDRNSLHFSPAGGFW